MDSMDHWRERMEAVEQQMSAMGAQTRTVARRLSWWRGFACGVMLLGWVRLPWQSGTVEDTPPAGRGERRAAVAQQLSARACAETAHALVIPGVHLRIVNGLGRTDPTQGLGKLLVGYNELRHDPLLPEVRTGSPPVVVGTGHHCSRCGGSVVGRFTESSGHGSSVSGGALTRPATTGPRSVGAATTPPAVSVPRSVAAPPGRRQPRTTGRRGPCLPTTRRQRGRGWGHAPPARLRWLFLAPIGFRLERPHASRGMRPHRPGQPDGCADIERMHMRVTTVSASDRGTDDDTAPRRPTRRDGHPARSPALDRHLRGPHAGAGAAAAA